MWHFDDDGKPAGPVSSEDVQGLIAAGRIGPRTLVWREGMIEWQPADRTDLATAFPGRNQPPALGSAYQDDFRYAGFWIRAAAYVIDAIILEIGALIVGGLAGLFIGLVGLASKATPDQNVLGAAGLIVGLVLQILYYGLFPSSGWQATPGKRLLGLHIIRTDGRKIGFGLSLGRYLAYLPSSFILGIGFFMIGWNKQKEGLHDMICSTRVVHGKPQAQKLSAVFD